MAEQVLTCKKCGCSTKDDESIWIANVKWPIRIRLNAEGLSYKVAELENNQIVELIDWDDIICDACKGEEIDRVAPTK